MTRSRKKDPQPSCHAKPNPIPMKKGGHGTANWGSSGDEIEEGLAMANEGDYGLSHSAEDMGAHKLHLVPPEKTQDEVELAPLDDEEVAA